MWEFLGSSVQLELYARMCFEMHNLQVGFLEVYTSTCLYIDAYQLYSCIHAMRNLFGTDKFNLNLLYPCDLEPSVFGLIATRRAVPASKVGSTSLQCAGRAAHRRAAVDESGQAQVMHSRRYMVYIYMTW